eukprot:CAMPEP_0119310608 /NCGR_PEP_ID=MMETSP1333-20130426/19669_1 /TAXON_ID=418940 /ORGANISM="Scyphosphaera apsteinii, Strain RCC1455" /LENGTH=325 /DNA_ID=CAMNT_0007314823 /DNA_START=111 /DNA_END=1088 /DNA_ORIENTATION=+
MIIAQLELFAMLSRRGLVPTVLSRKLTHIGSGTAMTTALVLFPHDYWPARLAVSLFLIGFMLLFAAVAHMPEEQLSALPPLVRSRLEGMVVAMCRSGDRRELMHGTFYFAFVVATFVLLFWTAPINVIIFASLFIGDGIADPAGRLASSWASSCHTCRSPISASAHSRSTEFGRPLAHGVAPLVDAARLRNGARPSDAADHDSSVSSTDGSGKADKPLNFLQYQVGYFGVKSYPGSAAFFLGGWCAAAGWGLLFNHCGLWRSDFPMASFLKVAALCIGVATLAEAISPPHVDNLVVTYAAAAMAFCLAQSGVASFLLLNSLNCAV